MALTNDQLRALEFGYLTGADLIRCAAPQLLIKQTEIDTDALQNGCDTACIQIQNKLRTKYDFTAEFAKRGADRDKSTVKVAAWFAARNILGNSANVSEFMMEMFKWADKEVLTLRSGQDSMQIPEAPANVVSKATLIDTSFSTLG